MANTPNLDLVKPAGTDHALVSVINSNSDKIDAGVGTLSEQIGTKTKFLNLTSSDTAATAYAKLNALSNLDVATIFIDGAVMNTLTGGSITTSANGLVVKGNASTYRFNLMVGASTKTVIFTMNNVSASSWGTIAYFRDIYDQIANICTMVQFDLPTSVTIASGAIGQALLNFNIKTSTAVDSISNKTLASIFGNKTILGVVCTYSTGVGMIPEIGSYPNGISCRLYNATGSSVTVTAIRLLVFAI